MAKVIGGGSGGGSLFTREPPPKVKERTVYVNRVVEHVKIVEKKVTVTPTPRHDVSYPHDALGREM